MLRARSSSIQYWLYAVLATRFGDALALSRTHVARMYDVNRHDFEAKASYECQGDRFEFAANLSQFMVRHLAEAGYEPDQYGASGYSKRFTEKGRHYEVCVRVQYEPEWYGVKNDTVSLGVSLRKLGHLG